MEESDGRSSSPKVGCYTLKNINIQGEPQKDLLYGLRLETY